jgi:hypothetical protein
MNLLVDFTTTTCCYSNCGITWAQPKTYDTKKQEDHTSFFCPNGHSQYYLGKSDLEKARADLTQTEERLNKLRDCAEHKKRRITSLKGVITKLKKAKG